MTCPPMILRCGAFEQLLHHRIPLYRKIADRFGYTIPMSAVPTIRNDADFNKAIAASIDGAAG